MATTELIQLTVVFWTIDMFIHLLYYIKIYWGHEAKIHESETKIKAKTYEAKATKFGPKAIMLWRT